MMGFSADRGYTGDSRERRNKRSTFLAAPPSRSISRWSAWSSRCTKTVPTSCSTSASSSHNNQQPSYTQNTQLTGPDGCRTWSEHGGGVGSEASFVSLPRTRSYGDDVRDGSMKEVRRWQWMDPAWEKLIISCSFIVGAR